MLAHVPLARCPSRASRCRMCPAFPRTHCPALPRAAARATRSPSRNPARATAAARTPSLPLAPLLPGATAACNRRCPRAAAARALLLPGAAEAHALPLARAPPLPRAPLLPGAAATHTPPLPRAPPLPRTPLLPGASAARTPLQPVRRTTAASALTKLPHMHSHCRPCAAPSQLPPLPSRCYHPCTAATACVPLPPKRRCCLCTASPPLSLVRHTATNAALAPLPPLHSTAPVLLPPEHCCCLCGAQPPLPLSAAAYHGAAYCTDLGVVEVVVVGMVHSSGHSTIEWDC
ncbi:unnamed protein product [Closterium sp. NIES-54]